MLAGLKLYGGSNTLSPVVHLHLEHPSGNAATDTATLRRIADHVLSNSNILVTVSHYSNLDWVRPPASLIIFVNVALTDAELANISAALRKATKAVLNV